MNLLAEFPLAEVVHSAARGDRSALGKIYDRFAPVVHGVLLSRVPPADAEDLVQDVFVIVMNRLPGLRDPAAFPAWILSISRNVAAEHHRRSRSWRWTALPDREPSINPETLMLLNTLQSLPEAYRETLVLRLVEGLTGMEISERTGLTPESVRVNLHRGMKLLREKLGIEK